MSFVRQHSGAIVWSVMLHVAVAAALMVNIALPRAPRPTPTNLVIEAVVVDQAALNAEIEKRERAVREAEQRRLREQRQAREAEERQRREREEAARREQERVAEQRRQQERAEQEARAKAEAEARAKAEAEARAKAEAERARAEAERREQERLAAERREREQREREEAARREREAAARAQAQREAELMAAAAAERERLAAEQAGLKDQYIRLLQNHVERNWIPPPSAGPGISCTVDVVQIPSGDVISVRVGQCNGDAAVVRSIEAAVRRASPLPRPPHPSLFERNLIIQFEPEFQ